MQNLASDHLAAAIGLREILVIGCGIEKRDRIGLVEVLQSQHFELPRA